MKKTLIIYASMSGNTEDIAKLIGKRLQEDEMEVTYEEMDACDSESIKEYDHILAGSYTWGMGIFHMKQRTFMKNLLLLILQANILPALDQGITRIRNFVKQSTYCMKDLRKQGRMFLQTC